MRTGVEVTMVPKETLEEIEQRAVRVNGLLNRIGTALDRGDLERVRNLLAEAHEANWANRRALIEAGVRDSIRGDAPAPPDDDGLLDTDALDLGELRGLMKHPRSEE